MRFQWKMRSYFVFLLRKGLITWQCDLWYTWLWLTRKWKYMNFYEDFTEVFFSKNPINNISALVQIKAWHRPGYKLLYEPKWLDYRRIYASLGLSELETWIYIDFMMTSSNGNIFRVTCHLCGEFTGPRWIPLTKASDDAELWRFLWSAPE